MNNIRNFCIIAHIDHGKSTLADRFLELTETVDKRQMKEQLLDTMELERERGITIKLQPVRMEYKNYILNLIDTPGHVDFTYEVSRSLAAVEGAILLVDATQGIQAQTLANYYLAVDQGLKIIPVINKIDLANARVDEVEKELIDLLKCKSKDVLKVSAKTGENVEKILDTVVEKINHPVAYRRVINHPLTPSLKRRGRQPANSLFPNNSTPSLKRSGDKYPTLTQDEALQALIFDSIYDDYKGVVAYIRLMNGEVKTGDKIYLISTKKQSEVIEVGYFKPELKPADKLSAGEIGYIVTGLKDLSACQVGDTVINAVETRHALSLQLPGYRQIKPMVFAGLFCKEGVEPKELREGLEKIKLTDASLFFEPENSPALGPGFRCGFLGLLHLEIIQERLRREYELDLVVTAPSVVYRVKTQGTINNKQGKNFKTIHSPQELPNSHELEEIQEPWVKIDAISPKEYMGNLMKLISEKTGIYLNTEHLSSERIILHYELPLSSILTDFYDKLKSVSSGYASLNYELIEYRPCEVERLDILVAEELVDSLATIVYKNTAYQIARKIVDSLKQVLPRQMFEIKIQAVLNYDKRGRKDPATKRGTTSRSAQAGGKIIASSRIAPMRKDVTAKLYGGDVTRKRKLLEKQKKGKKRMMSTGRVDIPTEAYLAVLKR